LIDLNSNHDMKRLRKVSEVITKWNTNFTYSSTYNSQVFVDEIIAALAIELIFTAQLKSTLENLRTTGIFMRIYKGPDGKEKVFNSHEELDTYCIELFKKSFFNYKYRWVKRVL